MSGQRRRTPEAKRASVRARAAAVDPVRLEVFRNLFVSVCEEMGIALMRTGCSPNIKERRDYSCAVFDGSGRAVALGDHMPVHLGSMPASVESALDELDLEPGDVALLNDPFRGGTHLPDVTVVAPLTGPSSSRRPLFYIANRAHHSDVGGMVPGSMPLATDIHQEGIVMPPVLIRRKGRMAGDVLRIFLANSRTPAEREGDLHAQFAALATGQRRLEDMIERYGARQLTDYARHLQAYSSRVVRAAIRRIPDGTYRFEDRLDDDGVGSGPIVLSVEIRVRGDRTIVDFTSCPDQVRGGVNAVGAIARSAVYYVFRCLVPASDGDIPWNAGGFDSIEVRLRPGSVLDARPPAAVAAGNVETSQRIVDLITGALARALPETIPAASQGTMNNLALGGVDPHTGEPFAYYETIGGGMGGRPGGHGISGVHTHMTNSLNTPIEAIENALPVVVERYGLRRGSGGAGRHRGGDGIIRSLRFLAPVHATVISERRAFPPWGLGGGGPGRRGVNTLVSSGGRRRELGGKINLSLEPDDTLVIETPGGGGWGAPARRDKGRAH